MGTSYFIQCLGYDVFGALITVQTRTTSVGTEADPCDDVGPWDAVVYGVDATGRRVTRNHGTTQTAWLYQDALNPVAQLDDLGRIEQVYVYATRGHVPDAIQVFNPVTGTQTATWAVISDLRGSVRAVVDVATGTVVQQLSYDAWGVVVHDSAPGTQPFGYAGGLYDHATGLVRYGARDYDPLVGRWTAPDPIGFGGGDTNLYAYVGGDPVNFVDPTGLQSMRACAEEYPGWPSGTPGSGDGALRFSLGRTVNGLLQWALREALPGGLKALAAVPASVVTFLQSVATATDPHSRTYQAFDESGSALDSRAAPLGLLPGDQGAASQPRPLRCVTDASGVQRCQ